MKSNRNLLEVEFNEEVFYEIFPEWQGCKLKISQLSGGITNKLYRVKSEKGDLTVRIYGDKTELFIHRDFEVQAIEEMSKIGVSSKMVKYMPEAGVTIVEFIDDSIVLTNEHFLDKSLYPKIVEPIKKIHNSGVRLKKIFNPTVEVRKMASILEGIDVEYSEFDIDGTVKRLKNLSAVINIQEADFTACHNDLLADNFILIKEEFKHKYDSPMYIIDWEYAGMAPKYYDIADMFQEVLIPRESEKLIVEEYCEGQEFDKTLYYIDLFKPFPDMYWFLWSLIQLNISTIEFDFYNYGKVKYENAQKNLKLLRNEYGVVI
ncbi:MAG: choline/ethanolamine kinase family protein [Thermodesulfobacteriota bacterium]|nr:choline/ethanolamine kinase family protein [Thermodesulfobacteriota bacterium]